MHLLVSPGALSGALSAAQVAAAVRRGWLHTAPDTEIRVLPMSDGAAGLLDAVHTARGGQLVSVTAHGPLGDPVPATLLHVPGTGGGSAYVEAGQVLGRQLVPAGQELRYAEEGSSAGLGELLLAARDLGAGRVVVGLGEAATHDGGVGLVRALAGAGPEEDIDADVLAAAHRVLADADVVVAAATQAPLLGLHGSGAMLADRLGPAEAQRLDSRAGELAARMERLGRALPARTVLLGGGHEHGGPSRPGRADGTGAGGGAANALGVLGGRLLHGPDVVASAVGLPEAVASTDVALTATAVLDAPAVDASVVATVGRAAMEHGLPVVVLAEEVHTSRREVARAGISATYETGAGGVDALEAWARRLARTWALGA